MIRWVFIKGGIFDVSNKLSLRVSLRSAAEYHKGSRSCVSLPGCHEQASNQKRGHRRNGTATVLLSIVISIISTLRLSMLALQFRTNAVQLCEARLGV